MGKVYKQKERKKRKKKEKKKKEKKKRPPSPSPSPFPPPPPPLFTRTHLGVALALDGREGPVGVRGDGGDDPAEDEHRREKPQGRRRDPGAAGQDVEDGDEEEDGGREQRRQRHRARDRQVEPAAPHQRERGAGHGRGEQPEECLQRDEGQLRLDARRRHRVAAPRARAALPLARVVRDGASAEEHPAPHRRAGRDLQQHGERRRARAPRRGDGEVDLEQRVKGRERQRRDEGEPARRGGAERAGEQRPPSARGDGGGAQQQRRRRDVGARQHAAVPKVLHPLPPPAAALGPHGRGQVFRAQGLPVGQVDVAVVFGGLPGEVESQGFERVLVADDEDVAASLGERRADPLVEGGHAGVDGGDRLAERGGLGGRVHQGLVDVVACLFDCFFLERE